MPYESWDAEIDSNVVHFEFLPPSKNTLRKNDGIIIDNDRLESFTRSGLNTIPFYEKNYTFNYIKDDLSSWTKLIDEKDITFYLVN